MYVYFLLRTVRYLCERNYGLWLGLDVTAATGFKDVVDFLFFTRR